MFPIKKEIIRLTSKVEKLLEGYMSRPGLHLPWLWGLDCIADSIGCLINYSKSLGHPFFFALEQMIRIANSLDQSKKTEN